MKGGSPGLKYRLCITVSVCYRYIRFYSPRKGKPVNDGMMWGDMVEWLSPDEKNKPVSLSQRGSVTVAIAFLLPVMLLMVALIVNINQLIFTKIRLQNTVDACALSAAAVQAAGLNEIADLNREMAMEHETAARILQSGIWRNFGQAARAAGFFRNGSNGVLDHIRAYQERANSRYAEKAEDTAQYVKALNFPETTLVSQKNAVPLAILTEVPKRTRVFFYTESYSKGSPRQTLNWQDPGRRDFADNRRGDYVILARRKTSRSTQFTMPERVVKRSTASTYVDYEITLPTGSFALAGGIFGPFPELRARAAAKPAAGNVYHGEPEYRAVLIK